MQTALAMRKVGSASAHDTCTGVCSPAMRAYFAGSKLVTTWIAATLAASLLSIASAGALGAWLAFDPGRIWSGEVWRIATWMFVETDPVRLICTCVTIYRLGGELAPRWGDHRLQRYMTEVFGAAALAILALALISDDAWRIHKLGGWAVIDALVITWARQYPHAILTMWGLLHVSGRRLIGIVFAANVVFAAYFGLFFMAPELCVCAAAYWYPAERLARYRR